MKSIKSVCALLLLASVALSQSTTNPNFAANSSGRIMASEFDNWAFQSLSGISSGAQTVTLNGCYVKVGTAYVNFYPIAVNVPLLIQDGTSNSETVTPTSVTQPTLVTAPSTVNPYSCTFTATFANSHLNSGFTISSGDGGLAEAQNYAVSKGISAVTVDSTSGITDAMLKAAVPMPLTQIEDLRGPQIQYWNPLPLVTTSLATPTTLTAQAACDSTHTFCSDATVAGSASWGSTVYGCVAYVDVMGLEGPCSGTANFTSVASKAIDVAAPAASAGAVGYTLYLSLSGGTYALAYQVPITASVCTLTTIETITPACAVTNATYGQASSAAQFTGYPVNTSPLMLLATTASSTTVYVGTPGGRTSYGYVASSKPAVAGMLGSYPSYTITTAAASTVPQVMATISLPSGFFNTFGKSIRVCGSATEASAGSTSTITQIQFLLDAPGSNVAGAPVIIGGPKVTSTLITSNADFYSFCQTLTTTVSGAGATAGTMQATDGFLSESYGAGVAGVGSTGPTLAPAAVGSLNLAGTAGFTNRLHIAYLHTTGTDGAGITLGNLTVQLLN